MELFSDYHLKNKDNIERNAVDVFTNKIIGIYFSAKWCPPCRTFTPKLREVYVELKKRKVPFEVVFISFDKNKEEMLSYLEELHGNWWYLPYDSKLKEELTTKYEIEMVPKLFIISPSGDIITKTGRKEVEDRGVAAFRSWLTGAGISSARIRTPDFEKQDINLNNPTVLVKASSSSEAEKT